MMADFAHLHLHTLYSLPDGPAGGVVPSATTPRMTLDVEIEGHVEADAAEAEAFWKAFALLAAEALDGGDLAGEDRGPREEAA